MKSWFDNVKRHCMQKLCLFFTSPDLSSVFIVDLGSNKVGNHQKQVRYPPKILKTSNVSNTNCVRNAAQVQKGKLSHNRNWITILTFVYWFLRYYETTRCQRPTKYPGPTISQRPTKCPGPTFSQFPTKCPGPTRGRILNLGQKLT